MRAARAILVSVVGVTAAACAGASPPSVVEPVGPTTIYDGHAVAVHGPTAIRAGDACRVGVRQVEGNVFNCRIRVLCGEERLYGLVDSGYNLCTRDDDGRFVFADDTRGTRRDGDPRMRFDLRTGETVISDDDPDLRVEIQLEGFGPDDQPPEHQLIVPDAYRQDAAASTDAGSGLPQPDETTEGG